MAHHKRTQKRKVAIIVLQRMYRGGLGRARVKYFREVRSVMKIQWWLRVTWAKRHLRKGVRNVVQMQTFRRRVWPSFLVTRRHLGMRDQAMEITSSQMNELGKIMKMDDYFDDPETHPHQQRMEVANFLFKKKSTIRHLYLKYSMLLVSSPDKAFQMSRAQFIKFVKESGIFGKTIEQRDCENIFTVSNMEVGQKKISKNAVAEAQVMMPDEFTQAIVLLSNQFLGDKIRPLVMRLEYMFENHFDAIAEIDFSPPEAPGLEEEGSETQECLKAYGSQGGRISKCFNHYSGGDSIDCVEWMETCKDCLIIDASTSFSKVLEIFLRCNQEELEEYFTDMPNPETIAEMSLELDEFILAIVATANLQPKKKPKDTYVNKLSSFLDKLLCNGTKKFMPEQEMVKDWEK